jgi:hypothetical protein
MGWIGQATERSREFLGKQSGCFRVAHHAKTRGSFFFCCDDRQKAPREGFRGSLQNALGSSCGHFYTPAAFAT